MRKANVYCRGTLAGILSQETEAYTFEYHPDYLRNPAMPAISLTFPKQEPAFRSTVLFPFFFGLLAEGENKSLECRRLRIDENDHFSRLLKTCTTDTIGGITIREVS